jgi:hypothetical protein
VAMSKSAAWWEGRDGAKTLEWRKTKTDEQWVDLAAASDAEWAADVKRTTGVEVKLSAG